MTPTISIVTPCLNRAATIEAAIASVAAQSYPALEHIVIDGGSTDGTLDILARHPHLRVVSEPDRNLYDAINKGLALSQGDVWGLLNSDDELKPGALAAVARAFETHPEADMATGGAEIVEAGRAILVHNDERLKALGEPGIVAGIALTNSRFMRRRFMERVGTFDIRFPVMADKDYLMRALLLHPRNVVLPDVVYRYLRHPGSLTMSGSDIRGKLAAEALDLTRLRLAHCLPGSEAFHRYRRWRAWAVGYAAGLDAASGRWGGALRSGGGALRFDPFWPLRFAGLALVHWRERRFRNVGEKNDGL